MNVCARKIEESSFSGGLMRKVSMESHYSPSCITSQHPEMILIAESDVQVLDENNVSCSCELGHPIDFLAVASRMMAFYTGLKCKDHAFHIMTVHNYLLQIIYILALLIRNGFESSENIS